jgi:hypothetical protein
MWPNEKLPHPWCENTVSHHGVKVAASLVERGGGKRMRHCIDEF